MIQITGDFYFFRNRSTPGGKPRDHASRPKRWSEGEGGTVCGGGNSGLFGTRRAFALFFPDVGTKTNMTCPMSVFKPTPPKGSSLRKRLIVTYSRAPSSNHCQNVSLT